VESRAHFTTNGRVKPGNRPPVPLLDARFDGPAERFAGRLRGEHPAAVFFAALLAGFVVLGLLAIALGLVVTDVLLHAGGVARDDESVVTSLVADRTPSLTDASEVGSALGGAPFLPALAAALALVFAVLRKWRIAAFTLFALAVESATYRVTSLVVPRERPPVTRLDDLPANDSFPSGHTAASVPSTSASLC
jgi:membrane-associated phospholipid phosphatase